MLRVRFSRRASSSTAGRLDRIPGEPDRSREDVRGPARDDRQRWHMRPGAVREQAVDHLVHRAVATEGDQDVEPVGARPARQVGRVATTPRVRHLKIHLGSQGAREHVATACVGGGGVGIHHEESAHDQDFTGRYARHRE